MARKSDVWTGSQIEFLKSAYSSRSWEELSRVLEKSSEAIRRKANSLGLSRGRAQGWSEQEDEELRMLFGNMVQKDLEAKFNRSYAAIFQHARLLGLSNSQRWTEEELNILRENYASKDWPELERMLGRSVRSMKHAVRTYGLGVSKRSRWAETELSVLRAGVSKKSGELSSEVHRTADAIAQKRRLLLGTARRSIRDEWGVPSENLAYVLGALCSDVMLNQAGMTLCIHPSDAEFGTRFAQCAHKVFGLLPKTSLRDGAWNYKGEKFFGEYFSVGVYSTDLLRMLGTESSIRAGNVRGESGEWIEFIDEKFFWVWSDEFFWDFMRGLFDGDGHVADHGVSIRIKPVRSRSKVKEEIERRGYSCSEDVCTLYVNGGEQRSKTKEFLEAINSSLERKRWSFVANGVQRDKAFSAGVRRISRADAEDFLQRTHYLKTLPGAVDVYGYIVDGKIAGVAAFGATNREAEMEGLELKRFAMDEWVEEKASKVISEILRVAKENHPGAEFIKTFADHQQNHVGTIYQATNALYVGQSIARQSWVAPSGKSYEGAFHVDRMKSDGVLKQDCVIKRVPGLHKYVYPIGERARKYFETFAMQYPKKLTT